MNDANYQRSRIATPGRIVAVIFVTVWIICAFLIGGLVLAIRAALLFMIPLTLVCMPDLFARIATFDAKWKRQLVPRASALMIRLLGWLVIIGVSVAWIAFHFALQR
ncbi:MAG: hypothetical protein ABF334_06910 [Akkermansiaceae bacterium]